jgi:hypothetical protein
VNRTVAENYLGPCVTTYRTLFGAIKSAPGEIQKDVLDPRRFETLRRRYHKIPRKHVQGDVSRIPVDILKSKRSFERPLLKE